MLTEVIFIFSDKEGLKAINLRKQLMKFEYQTYIINGAENIKELLDENVIPRLLLVFNDDQHKLIGDFFSGTNIPMLLVNGSKKTVAKASSISKNLYNIQYPVNDQELVSTIQNIKQDQQNIINVPQYKWKEQKANYWLHPFQVSEKIFFVRFKMPLNWSEVHNADKEAVAREALEHHIIELGGSFADEPDLDHDMLESKKLPEILEIDKERLVVLLIKIFESKSLSFTLEHPQENAHSLWLKLLFICSYDKNGQLIGIFITQRNITGERLYEEVVIHKKLILEKIATGAKVKEGLVDLCEYIESIFGNAYCAIFKIDKDLAIKRVVAPSLPEPMLYEVEKIKLSHRILEPKVISTKVFNIKDYLDEDSKGIFYHALDRGGVKGCWSLTVRSPKTHKIRAVISLFFIKKQTITSLEANLFEVAASVAELLLQKEKHARALKKQKTIALKNEVYYKTLIESSNDLIAVLDVEGKVNFMSRSSEDIIGYKPEELTGKSIFDIIPDEDVERGKALLKEVVNTGSIPMYVFRIRHKSGVLKYLESQTAKEIKIGSASKGYLFNCRDITDRLLQERHLKKLQQEQAKSEERFRKLAELLPGLISLWNIQASKPIYLNKPAFLGYDVINQFEIFSSISIIHKKDRKRVSEFRNSIIKSTANDYKEIEYRMLAKNKKWEWVRHRHIVMEFDNEGVPLLLLVVTTITTEEHKAQEALEESKARLLALIENTDELIWSIDKNYKITAFNNSFRILFNRFLKMDPEIGSDVFLYSPPEQIKLWEGFYNEALEGNRFSKEISHNIDSNIYYQEVWFNPIYNSKGKVEGVSCFLQDITKRKTFENELKQANFELDSFVYRSSHDMRAPLRSILGLVNLMRSEKNAEEQENYLNMVERSVNKLDTFIDELTAFSRNSRLPTAASLIDFEYLIEMAYDGLKFMNNAQRLKLIINVKNKIDFYSDESRLNIIFQNLISNAIKYQNLHKEISYIQFDITVNENEVLIVAEDNGIGIRAELIDKIFDMFFRASEVSEGSGLGLYIVKQVVKKLNGEIDVTSPLGNGTRFVIKLPNSADNAK